MTTANNAPASDKQIAFIATLKARAVASATPAYGAGERGEKAARTALVLSLPTPADSREASAQIDALQGDILGYARTHAAWAQPIMTTLAAKAGRDSSGIPADTESVHGGRCEWTPEAWASYIRGLLG